ncbi:unnamed protein product [Effrenium voratum]|nr:unnamed protein product [Effrenium voratum]
MGARPLRAEAGDASAPAPSAAADAVRLWSISDVHTDIEDNLAWVDAISDTAYTNDALIVAGDVSDRMDVLERTLSTLQRKFREVFFVPGNHDLWAEEEEHSITKLHRILALCARLGVHTTAKRVGGQQGCWVCPILSWHHQSWDPEPELEGWDVPDVAQCMVDFARCRFPPPVSMFDDSAARRVDVLNDSLKALEPLAARGDEPLVTFSHFLPRIDLLLEKRFLTLPCLAKASGSKFLQRRVEDLKPDVHIFGHTHFGWDAEHDGVRYIQAALGYPHERQMRWPSMANADFGESTPLLVWSSEGGFAPKARCRWSAFYEHHGRHPEKVFQLASYAARGYKKTSEKATECMPDFSFW